MPNNAAPPLDVGSDCLAATRAELAKLNALESPEAQIALALAAILDSGRSVMAAAANAKELRATLDSLRALAPKAKGSVDEFTGRRAQRLAAQRRAAAEDSGGA